MNKFSVLPLGPLLWSWGMIRILANRYVVGGIWNWFRLIPPKLFEWNKELLDYVAASRFSKKIDVPWMARWVVIKSGPFIPRKRPPHRWVVGRHTLGLVGFASGVESFGFRASFWIQAKQFIQLYEPRAPLLFLKANRQNKAFLNQNSRGHLGSRCTYPQITPSYRVTPAGAVRRSRWQYLHFAACCRPHVNVFWVWAVDVLGY